MHTLYIDFTDNTQYQVSLDTEQLPYLYVSVQETKVGENQVEDFLDVKFQDLSLMIAPMRTIKSYRLVFQAHDVRFSSDR